MEHDLDRIGLANTEELLEFTQILLDTVPSAVYSTDMENRITSWNKRAEELTGYSAGEVMGKACKLFGCDPCMKDCGLFSYDESEGTKGVACKLMTKSGEVLTVSKSVSRIVNRRGQSIGKMECFEDITERVTTEEQNQASEMFLAIMASSVKELIHNEDLMEAITRTLGQLGRATRVQGVHLYLTEPEESGEIFIRQTAAWVSTMEEPLARELLQPGIPLSQLEPLLALLLDGSAYHRIQWEQRDAIKKLLRLPADIHTSLVIPIFVREVFRGFLKFDESGREHLWTEAVFVSLSSFTDSIEKSMERDLMLRELEQSRQKALEASEAKSRFLASMSHEIRTPMNAILGYSALLSDLVTEETGASYLHAIQKAGNMLMNLINDILYLSRIEAGQLALQEDYLDLRKVLSEIREVFQMKLEERQVELVIQVDPQLPEIIVQDETRVRQILFNLIGNAVKFTEQGSIRVHVGIVKSLQKGGPQSEQHLSLLTLEVQDTGIGIPQDQLGQIFEPFKQKEGQDSRKYGGTGLGLAITKRLIQEMKGEIQVESRVGEGARFRILLPLQDNLNQQEPAGSARRISPSTTLEQPRKELQLRKKEVSSVPPVSEAESQAISSDPTSGQGRILVVDDVAENLEIAAKVLSANNYAVTLAQSGQTALTLLEEADYDLILMDIMMPEMDGFETCLRIKQLEHRADIPVIFLTAKADIESITRAFEAGAADYIRKPYNHREFLARIRTHIELKRSRAQLELLTTVDPVTLLCNAREILNKIQYEADRFERNGIPFSIIALELLDYDHCSRTGSAEFRDLMLRKAAELIQSHIRKMDFAARWEQGSFLLLLPETSGKNAQVVREKLMNILQSEKISDGQKECSLRIAAGIAVYETAMTPQQLVWEASTTLQFSRNQFEPLPLVDPVTRMLSARELLNKIQAEADRFERKRRPFSVVALELLDYDRCSRNWKPEFLNQALKTAADSIHSNIRKMDSVARWRNGVFLVLLPETSADRAAVVANKLRSLLENLVISDDRKENSLRVATGIAVYETPISPQQLIRETAAALKQNSEAGEA